MYVLNFVVSQLSILCSNDLAFYLIPKSSTCFPNYHVYFLHLNDLHTHTHIYNPPLKVVCSLRHCGLLLLAFNFCISGVNFKGELLVAFLVDCKRSCLYATSSLFLLSHLLSSDDKTLQ